MNDPRHQADYYNGLRDRLIEVYQILTEWHFEINIPMSNFFTTTELKNIGKNDQCYNIAGLGRSTSQIVTIERLLHSFKVMGRDACFTFRYPQRDSKIVFEATRDWIKNWIELKDRWNYYQTPPLSELELVDSLCRFVFEDYRYYYYESVCDVPELKHTPTNEEEIIYNAFLSTAISGRHEEMSYVDFIGEYKDRIGYTTADNDAFSLASTFGLGS